MALPAWPSSAPRSSTLAGQPPARELSANRRASASGSYGECRYAPPMRAVSCPDRAGRISSMIPRAQEVLGLLNVVGDCQDLRPQVDAAGFHQAAALGHAGP